MRCAKGFCQFNLLRADIDGDDRIGAGEGGSLNYIQPDAAAADDCDALSRPYSRRSLHRTHPGNDRAAENGCNLHRNIVWNLDRSLLWDDHIFAETGDRVEMM